MVLYLSVMSAEKESDQLYMMQQLQDIMADVELYGWEPIQDFHGYGSSNWSKAILLGLIKR